MPTKCQHICTSNLMVHFKTAYLLLSTDNSNMLGNLGPVGSNLSQENNVSLHVLTYLKGIINGFNDQVLFNSSAKYFSCFIIIKSEGKFKTKDKENACLNMNY